jgi:hypothetical protein
MDCELAFQEAMTSILIQSPTDWASCIYIHPPPLDIHLQWKTNKPPQPQRWTRPPEGLLKANYDDSFFSESKKGGWGFIIRDHQGKAISAGSGSILAVHVVECTEAQACVAALQAASNQGIPRLILETDSMVTVKALQSDEMDLCPTSVLYREARDLIRLCFISV